MNEDTLTPYLVVAQQLANDLALESGLPQTSRQLPPLTSLLLANLAEQGEVSGRETPRLGWAILAVANAAAQHQPQQMLQAQAAWHLGRAANQWVRPKRVAEAIAQAQRLFGEEQVGWLAACQWQQYALPWTIPDFSEATRQLSQALHQLEAAQFDHWLPHCRLSLAYAHILTNGHTQANQLLQACESAFADWPFERACCWLFRASSLRRRDQHPQAIDYLQQAKALFVEWHAPVYASMADYQLALSLWATGQDSQQAEQLLADTAHKFEVYDLPLWTAMALNGLTAIYRSSGRLAEASQTNEKARAIYQTNDPVPGLQADNLSDAAILERDKGNYSQALFYLFQAEKLYEQLASSRHFVAFTQMLFGNIYTLAGRYQRALQFLEKALTYYQQANLPDRLAQCQIYLSHVWQQLGQFAQAHHYLQQALTYYQDNRQPTWHITTLNRQAHIFLEEERHDEAIKSLVETVALARQQGEQPYLASALRLLGEVKLAQGDPAGAYPLLCEANQILEALEIVVEQLFCHLAFGDYFYNQQHWQEAKAAWQKALALNQTGLLEVEWRAYGGLAKLAERDGQWEIALTHYYQLGEALEKMYHDFWQANLYLSRPEHSLAPAIRLAIARSGHTDCLVFIEQSKAQIVTRQLLNPGPTLPHNQQHLALKGEINWLKSQIRINWESRPGRIRPGEELQLAQQLQNKIALYDQLVSQLERSQQPAFGFIPPFHWPQFQRLANAILGFKWVAINYYLQKDTLCYAFLTPDGCQSGQRELSADVSFILEELLDSGRDISHLTDSDLTTLGEWLFPASLRPHLQSDTTLLISPHGALHRLPWPILLIREKPLVTTAIPVIVPSFHHLARLWQRSVTSPQSSERGLLIAISDFQGRHTPLPEVSHEAATLNNLLGYCHQLRDEEATWQKVQEYGSPAGLSAYQFLHIASHAFHDHHTGRISGLALYDQDIWHDELWQLAPLPPLVTLSACSGNQSLIRSGDEPIGLATTCLAAGAQTVLGSLWPIEDNGLTNLMTTFYKNYLVSPKPALSLALSQRQAWRQHRPVKHWGGFICVGQP